MSDEAEGPTEYSLVMPFAVCRSNGGIYEDTAFVAGCHLGEIMEALKHDRSALCAEKREPLAWYVGPALVPQLDLVAMDKGYTFTAEPWDEHPDEHVLVTFTRRVSAVTPDRVAEALR